MELMQGANVKMWTEGVPVEHDALQQIRKVASLPVVHGHVAIMPDVHLGVGATIGSVIPTKSAIIPSAVGVDIGCGMCAVQTNVFAEDLPDSLLNIRHDIEKAVPVGFSFHDSAILENANGLYQRFPNLRILEKIKHLDEERMWKQLGTLGGGNHFIELCLDIEDRVWVMLHSGSRNIGKTIGECAINMAKEIAVRDGISLPDSNLAWLPDSSNEFASYVEGLRWAQDYAMINRDTMLHLVIGVLRNHFGGLELSGKVVNCHHNYASLEEHFGESVWVTRKGAVSAKRGEMGIIPGSMGAKSFIVEGLGNADSYSSCSHGAGRRMSRGEAKRQFSEEDLKDQTEGVECRKDRGVLDEIPGAYKDIDKVMYAQRDLVKVAHTLRQVLCVKG